MAVAGSTIQSPGSISNSKLKRVPDIDMDKSGKYKYILLKLHDPSKDREFKHIVRGYAHLEYHADIYDKVAPQIEENGLDLECVGGGRMEHEPNKKKINVFGYSQGYGKADHKITAAILQRKFHNYTITWSNDGY